jgi:hypothetical protein
MTTAIKDGVKIFSVKKNITDFEIKVLSLK